MPTPFPHRYAVSLDSSGGEAGRLTSGRAPELRGGTPAEFDGRDDWWGPEQLLLASLSLCLMTTFRSFASKHRLELRGYKSRASGILDRTPTGLGFTSLNLRVDLAVPAPDVTRAEALLDMAKRHCIVANSLKTAVGLEVAVNAVSQEPAPAPPA